MHEALFDDRFLKGTGIETLDFAKAMIDEGFHPMTMYFPLVVHGAQDKAFGRLTAFHGQMGMFLRALSYILSHGVDGLKQVAEDAVLNANYILESLKDVMTPSFDGPCIGNHADKPQYLWAV